MYCQKTMPTMVIVQAVQIYSLLPIVAVAVVDAAVEIQLLINRLPPCGKLLDIRSFA